MWLTIGVSLWHIALADMTIWKNDSILLFLFHPQVVRLLSFCSRIVNECEMFIEKREFAIVIFIAFSINFCKNKTRMMNCKGWRMFVIICCKTIWYICSMILLLTNTPPFGNKSYSVVIKLCSICLHIFTLKIC